jgi:hypothetical protein
MVDNRWLALVDERPIAGYQPARRTLFEHRRPEHVRLGAHPASGSSRW